MFKYSFLHPILKVSVAHLKPITPKLPEQGDGEELQYIYNGTAPAWSFDSTGINNSLESNNNENKKDIFLESSGEKEKNHNNLIDFQKLQKSKITNDVFTKHWRHFNRNVLLQMAYLTSLDPSDFLDIFKVELPPNTLVDILGTICTCLRVEKNEQEELDHQILLRKVCGRDIDENWTMKMLEVLTKCGRFSLSLRFVGEKTRAMIRELLDQLIQSDWCKNGDGENVARIQQTRFLKIQNLARLYKVNIDLV